MPPVLLGAPALRPTAVLALQRLLGNRATGHALGVASPVLQRHGGMRTEAVVKGLARDLLEVRKQEPIGRYIAAVWQVILRPLTARGVPPPRLRLINGGDGDGEFDRAKWRVGVDTAPRDISEANRHESIAETLVHELRHAEQAFQMARVLAVEGVPPDEIARRLEMHPAAAAAAAASLAGTPMTAQERREATPWLVSVLSGHSAAVLHRRRKYDAQVERMRRRLKMARLRLRLARQPPAEAEPRVRRRLLEARQVLARARRALEQAEARAAVAYAAYRALPMEDDAWALQLEVGIASDELEQLLSSEESQDAALRAELEAGLARPQPLNRRAGEDPTFRCSLPWAQHQTLVAYP